MEEVAETGEEDLMETTGAEELALSSRKRERGDENLSEDEKTTPKRLVKEVSAAELLNSHGLMPSPITNGNEDNDREDTVKKLHTTNCANSFT